MPLLSTPRLKLFPLSAAYLHSYLHNPSALENNLGYPISRDMLDETVTRAMAVKLQKMAAAAAERHDWYTYWLIKTKQPPFGAGLIGFKGEPDQNGSVEIGCGIDPTYRDKGYTTEAGEALLRWAFDNTDCQTVFATESNNPASARVLSKLGFNFIEQQNNENLWELNKADYANTI